MRIKFVKQWSGPYGVFVAGRTCELSGPMLAAAPKDSYVAIIAEEAKQTETPSDKQQQTPVGKQAVTSQKGTETDGKKARSSK